jgi:hypothetical protein
MVRHSGSPPSGARPGWGDFVDLAFGAVRRHARGLTEVTDRLVEVLDELADSEPPPQRPPVLRHRRLLTAEVLRSKVA